MRVALYARVSTESQQARGTIGSQLAVLRERVAVEGDEPVAEFRSPSSATTATPVPGWTGPGSTRCATPRRPD
jgi:DNA invertase Pin-like site-specific DNA recombinase